MWEGGAFPCLIGLSWLELFSLQENVYEQNYLKQEGGIAETMVNSAPPPPQHIVLCGIQINILWTKYRFPSTQNLSEIDFNISRSLKGQI